MFLYDLDPEMGLKDVEAYLIAMNEPHTTFGAVIVCYIDLKFYVP